MELFEPSWRKAAEALSRLPVTCMLGSSVGPEGFLSPEQLTAEERGSAHYRRYYDRDLALARSARPVMRPLCERFDFDLIVLDGNEYTAAAEFAIVEAVCRPRFLALHDAETPNKKGVADALAAAGARWKRVAAGRDKDTQWVIYEDVAAATEP